MPPRPKTYTTATRVIQKLGNGQFFSSILRAFLTIGIPVNVFFLLYFLSTGWQASLQLSAVIFVAAQWSWIGPLLIWDFETRLFPEFWQSIDEEGIIDGESLTELCSRYTSLSTGARRIVIYLWAFFLLAAFILTAPFMETIGMPQLPNVWFWLWCLGAFLSGKLTGQGFAGVMMMIHAVSACLKRPLRLNQYHADGLGGLSCFGRLAIGTTALFSSGAVFLPILMRVAKHSEFGPQVVYGLVFLYTIAIATCFLLPTFLVCRRAKNVKKQMLREASESIVKKDNYSDSKAIEANYHRNYFLDIKAMGIYPFNTWVIGKLIGSVGFPVMVVYLSQLLGVK